MPDDASKPHKHTEHSASAYNRLRRLQEHSRANMPAVLAHRATSTFTLHREPLPIEANDSVLVTIYPQDPFISEPEVRTMNAHDIAPGLINSRVRVQGRPSELAVPDEDGNYMFWPGDPRFDQVNVFYFTTFTLRMYERYARRALPWAFPSPRLTVNPHAGGQANAFYSEQDRLLGFHAFEANGDRISTAHSADIIAHEAAHAVLDGLRDLYNESFGLGPSAYHESFADITSMLVALHDDSLVRRLLEWTDGDLRTNNFVTQVAEHLTQALLESDDLRLQAHNIYLRNAFNDFVQTPFDALAYDPVEPEFTLGRQPHNYSRLLTGLFYDIFSGIYEHQTATCPPHIAIYRARDAAGAMLVFSIEIGAIGEFDYTDVGRCLLAADEILYIGRYYDVIARHLDERGIITADDCRAYIAQMREIPAVQLPDTINSAMASALFLERDIIPALGLDAEVEFVPMAAYRNANDYAFLTYFLTRRIELDGEQFQQFAGAKVDLFGGLTLSFDPSGRLRHACYRPVRDEDERQIKILLADLIAHDRITEADMLNGEVVAAMRAAGFRLDASILNRPGAGQLVKYPVMYDQFSADRTDIVTYLKQVGAQLRSSGD